MAVADWGVLVLVDCGVAGLKVLGVMVAVACLTNAPAVLMFDGELTCVSTQ